MSNIPEFDPTCAGTICFSSLFMRQKPPIELQRSHFESEDAHEESLIEWWFFQGYYQVKSSSGRHFMATLFRYRFEQDDGPATNCFQLLLSVLHESDKTHHLETWVDQSARLRGASRS